ncbi:mRNA splicing factor SYF2 [Paraphysoderma sedebokerense]|nr:mRNA splicing factor SYF2 [Paraphysoderma sedebokerense]
MEYSIEDVERWEEKQAKKAKRANTGFTDFTDLAHRKYARLTSQLKPDLESYGTQKLKASLSTDIVGGTEEQIYRDANSLAFVDGVGVKPSRDNVDKMVEDLQKQIETRGKSSRRRAYNPDEDITYINDRNRHFNKKISRAYDKYTQEIRDSFERGTAL